MLRIVLVSAFVFIVFNIFGQQQDLQTWVNAELSGELFKKIDFEIVPETRISNNSSFVKAILTDFDLSYKLSKNIRFGGQYRVQQKNYFDDISYLVNRFGIYGRIDFKIDKIRFNYRAIYQQEYEGINHREGGNIPLLEHRHRLAVSLSDKNWKLKPSLSYELFLKAKKNFFSEEFTSRLSAGINYELNNNISLSLGYKLQKEYFENNALTANILAVGFAYKL